MDVLLTSAATAAPAGTSIQDLFAQSFDAFTVLLVVGSVVAGAVIVRCVIEIRSANVLPGPSVARAREMIEGGRFEELESFVERDPGFTSGVLRAALAAPRHDAHAVRDAAELAASEQSAAWFRRIEPLNVIGNLGPLLGLAGTVWGMVKAFAALGAAGGQANPAALSEGISKALFHTLLGLMLAVPALTVFGFYRQVVDKLCTRAMTVSAELVEQLIARVVVGGGRRDGIDADRAPMARGAEAGQGAGR
ncbi:MAG: MotA/TolQ/ExbB proton channel family protein [Phycisphaerales bacterium]